MAPFRFVFSILLFFTLLAFSQGYSTNHAKGNATHKVGMTCDYAYCSTYCCYDSWSNYVCCDDDEVTSLWWFWFVFVLGLFFLSLCLGFCCRYRNRRRRQYLIITGERPTIVSTYGTGYVPPVMATAPPGYGTAYTPYPNAHLPSYTPSAESKGNPPRYAK